VQEVVVVDSQSSDGTVEYLREKLKGMNVRFLDHPPGLYESWNFGLQHIRASWSYIATVGDSMPGDSIEALLSTGQRNNSDLVISPPCMVSPAGKRFHKRWPIHNYLAWKGGNYTGGLTGLEVFLWNALSAPGSLLGSSASNLYRTGYLQAHPFPTGYRHACDTAWAITHSFAARWSITSDVYSEFLVHPASAKPAEPQRHRSRERLHQLARDIFSAVPDECFPDQRIYADMLEHYWDASLQSLQANRNFKSMSKQVLPWVLRPGAWRERARRNRLVDEAGRYRGLILERLSGPDANRCCA
jgi:hypothetical protein